MLSYSVPPGSEVNSRSNEIQFLTSLSKLVIKIVYVAHLPL